MNNVSKFILLAIVLGAFSVQASEPTKECFTYAQFVAASKKITEQVMPECTEGMSCLNRWKEGMKKELNVGGEKSMARCAIDYAKSKCSYGNFLNAILGNQFTTFTNFQIKSLGVSGKFFKEDLNMCEHYPSDHLGKRNECIQRAVEDYISAYSRFVRRMLNAADKCAGRP